MSKDPVTTQLYLIAPRPDALDEAALSAVLNEGVACLLVNISGFTEADAGALETMIGLADAADCPLVAGGDNALALDLAKRFALDGVHLSGAPSQVGWARKQLGEAAIVGYDAGLSRHDAMTAAEAGAEYILLGPLADLDPELPEWWQAVIETPLVLNAEQDVARVAGIADFVLVDGVFAERDPLARLRHLTASLTT